MPKILYVGGLDDTVTSEMVHAAFVPFGVVVSVQLPKDFKDNTSRGFAFVEFELEEDALDAIDNMDGSEILGRVIKVHLARQTGGGKRTEKAVWSAEDYLREAEAEAEAIGKEH